jgi:hypothetical protein
MVEAVCLVFVTVVGPQVEVSDDLHLLGEDLQHVLLEKRVPNSLNGRKVEFLAEVVQNRVLVGRVFTGLTEFGYRGPVGASADEDLVDVFSIDFCVVTEAEPYFLVKRVDEEVKELVLVYFTVCLLVGVHILSKQTF